MICELKKRNRADDRSKANLKLLKTLRVSEQCFQQLWWLPESKHGENPNSAVL